ncbi:carboxymuconolactone decarboxylase family protein [Asticcacaulis machinosus]|uniref:Carboxymuconolactone decarboxylase family protein n=1 Tax=Asticcacaulis machinosus TaxID=2984211 RepID=A0ABT5HIU9_9CAUL|nr:carboxymuconolactone decarboxylase family protein [Asticcacaulis machinosus]MDC7676153.1 carboxymuconolactone decarboxylase family protein [Asticcacaulis machinosus]
MNILRMMKLVFLLSLLGMPASAQEISAQKTSTQETSTQETGTDTPSKSPEPSRAQKLMGDISPKMAELTDEVLFGDIWERPQLSKRDRSLVTMSALIAMNRPDQLRSHMALAKQNGVTEEEIVETITHLAFYSGWPNAVTAIGVAREVFNAK